MPSVQSSYPNEAEVTRIAATEDAAARNRQITEAYWKLSAEVERRILGNANWCTFATWASQQAGVTIRHEDMTQLLRERLQSSWKITVIDAKLIELLVEGDLDLLQLVVNAVANLGPLKRSGDAVGCGNRKVFEEIGLLFARWLTLFPDIHSVTDSEMDGFSQGLKPGPPPDGQDVLKQAFGNYRAAALSTPFPGELQKLTSPDLLHLLAGFDPTPDSEGGSGVRDWANLQQRLRFIADLFRAYGEEKCLFDPLKADITAADS